MDIKLQKILPIVLSIVSVAGTISTSVLVALETPKANKKLEELKSKKDKPNPIDVIKVVAPCYWPALLTGTATIASTVSSTIISKKTEASLSATCIMLDQGWKKYKNKVKQVLGEEKHQEISREVAKDDLNKVEPKDPHDGKILYYEEHIGFFWTTPEDLAYAYADLNQRLQCQDYYGGTYFFGLIYHFLERMNADVENKHIKPEELNYGWSYDYLLDQFEYCWIHMQYEDVEENGRKFRRIWFTEEPIFDPSNYGEYQLTEEQPVFSDYNDLSTEKLSKELENE